MAFADTTNGCDNSPVVFMDQTPAGARPITQYVWSFGDGAVAMGLAAKDTSHLYAAPGSYVIKYNVITDVGCLSDTVSKTIQLSDQPVADFVVQGAACQGRTVILKDMSTAAAGNTISKWYWNEGIGSPFVNTSAVSVQPVYPDVLSYNATLQVETSTGCKSAVKTVPVQVHYLPVPDFSIPRICVSDPEAEFDDSSSIADNSEAQFTYLWNFGDGGSSTLKSGLHKYSAAGPETVTLTVTSKDGCVADTAKTFTVNSTQPVADFAVQTPDPLCSNKPILLLDESSVDTGSITKVEIYWDYLNDPTKKTVEDNPVKGETFTYQYPDFGTPAQQNFQVRYFTYSGINCISTPPKVQAITINASPQLQFDSLAPVCQEVTPFQVTAARELFGLPGSGVYSGAGISATGLFNPGAALPGSHPITYTYAAGNGCSASITKIIVVYPTPLVDAGPDRFLLEGGNIVLDATASGKGLTYLWTPALYLSNANVLTPTVTSPEDITYTITVTSSDGCVASDDVLVKILKNLKVPNAFSPNGDGINDTWMIQYLDTYPGCTVDVFNRYGQNVFHSTGYAKPWDGRVNGQPLPVGTYYWIINPKNGRQQISGSVTIVR